jgi:hypothetical protein
MMKYFTDNREVVNSLLQIVLAEICFRVVVAAADLLASRCMLI